MHRQEYNNNSRREGKSREEVSHSSSESFSDISVSGMSGRQDSLDSLERGRKHLIPSRSVKMKHKFSLDISEFHSEDEQMRLDDFFDEQIILERRVERKDVIFRPGLFHPQFIQLISEIIFKFTQKPDQSTFSRILDAFLLPGFTIFKDYPQPHHHQDQDSPSYTLFDALEDLIYRGKNLFFVYTFDWHLCHLSFVCCLIIFWLQIEAIEPEDIPESPKKDKPQGQLFIRNQKRKIKQNLSNVTCLYTESRSQQINSNQVIVMVLYHFLNFLRHDESLNLVQICNTQNKLINDIELFRRIKRKQAQFSSASNKFIFESQMKKYELQNKMISCLEKTHTLFHLITSHNFVSSPLLKFYQLDCYKNSRKDYQNKMQFTRIWIWKLIVNVCEDRKAQSVSKAGDYVVVFMGILKKMKKNCNLEGFSYLVPVLMNVKHFLPKIWKYVVSRRPSIQKILDQYADLLLKKQYSKDQLGEESSAIIWGQTIFDMTEKMARIIKNNNKTGLISLKDHQEFYDSFLTHLLEFRTKVQQEYSQEIENYNRNREIGSSFNMYLLDTYVPSLYRGCSIEEEWRKLKGKAEQVDNGVNLSFSTDLIDHIFIGSTAKYQKIDI